MEPEVKILPADGRQCSHENGIDPAGRKIICRLPATMILGEHSLCDRHAELAMIPLCGRNVTIKREVFYD